MTEKCRYLPKSVSLLIEWIPVYILGHFFFVGAA